MPIFSRGRKGRDVSAASTTQPIPVEVEVVEDEPQYSEPPRQLSTVKVEPEREESKDPWLKNVVEAEDVEELLHICTQQMKTRALDIPLLLLPFRPLQSDTNAAKSFIRRYYHELATSRYGYTGMRLQNDLKLIEPMALCSIMKWCWSRLRGGVVTYNTYQLFRIGEQNSNMAKNAFDTFIPISVDSEARQKIIFDFFDLLAAIAANSVANGLGARKLSRLAGWWAFDHVDKASDFDTAYKSWSRAANATTHLFFAYLRARVPDSKINSTMSQLPRSMQKLVAETEYPPATPNLLKSTTSKVLLLVDAFSPTPLALLRRAKKLEHRNGDPGFQRLCISEDPTKLLTPECCRVLECISADNYSDASDVKATTGVQNDASWSRFEDLGFTSFPNGTASKRSSAISKKSPVKQRRSPKRRTHVPAPSWNDFLASGFSDNGTLKDAAELTLPPEDILPPIHSQRESLKSTGPSLHKVESLKPAEVSDVNQIELDETFWWVWIASLAMEESPRRKAVFSKCLIMETEMEGRRWLVLEERLRRDSTPLPPPPQPITPVITEEQPIVVEKRNKFGFNKKTRGQRSASDRRSEDPSEFYQQSEAPTRVSASTSLAMATKQRTPSPDHEQRARVQAAAAALVQEKRDQEFAKQMRKRGRIHDDARSRTSSILSVEPGLARDAVPALQWARRFDKEIIRARYLGDSYAGKGGQLREISPNMSSGQRNGNHVRRYEPYGKQELDHRALPPLPRRSLLSLNDAMSTTSPTPPPGSRAAPQANMDAILRANTPPAAAQFTPITEKSEASKSLVPSPLVPKRRTVTSMDEVIQEHRRVVTDPLPVGITNDNVADPFVAGAESSQGRAESPDLQEPVIEYEPKLDNPKLRSPKHGSVRGLRKLFAKRVASEPAKGIAAQLSKYEANESKRSDQRKVNPKRSFFRRVTPASAPVAEPEQPPPRPVTPDEEPTNQELYTAARSEPLEPEQRPPYEERTASMVRAAAIRGAARSPTFSNFTHSGPIDEEREEHEPEPNWSRGYGAMEELPMHINNFHHEHDPAMEPMLAPRPIRVSDGSQFATLTAARLYNASHAVEPTTPKFRMPISVRMDSNPDLTADEGSSNNVTPEPQPGTAAWEASNRWKQIRQGAVARRASEEQSNTSGSPTHAAPFAAPKAVVMDKGDEDGEESIEARVARIKARVAELTGSSANSSPVVPQSSTYSRFARV